MDMDVKTFASGQEFLDSGFKDQNACLIADIKMPVMGGMELQKKVVAKGSKLPVIFITAFDSKNLRSQAKEAGAAGYFQIPGPKAQGYCQIPLPHQRLPKELEAHPKHLRCDFGVLL